MKGLPEGGGFEHYPGGGVGEFEPEVSTLHGNLSTCLMEYIWFLIHDRV